MMLIESVRKRLFFFFSNRNVETSDPGAFQRSRRGSLSVFPCDVILATDHIPSCETRHTRAKALGLSSSRLLQLFFVYISHLFFSLSLSLSFSFFFINFLARYLYKLSYSFCEASRGPAQLLHLKSSSITQRPKRIIFIFYLSLSLSLCFSLSLSLSLSGKRSVQAEFSHRDKQTFVHVHAF